MWADLGHSDFLYVPAVSNLVTPLETAQVFKLNRALGFVLVSSLLSTVLLL